RLPASSRVWRASPAAIGGGRRTLLTSPMTPLLRSGFLPLVALCAGLVGLAVLEYRWTDELARAEQDRLRTGMEAAATRFGDDLARELGRLIAAFRPRGGAFDGDDAARYVRQAEEWAAQAIDARVL